MYQHVTRKKTCAFILNCL